MEICFKTFMHELVCVLDIDSKMQSKEISSEKGILTRRRCIKEVWIISCQVKLF